MQRRHVHKPNDILRTLMELAQLEPDGQRQDPLQASADAERIICMESDLSIDWQRLRRSAESIAEEDEDVTLHQEVV